MFFSKPSPEWEATDLAAVERREADEPVHELRAGAAPLPAPAGRFGITDPQQWMDLCG
jgi:hypothetical protein